MRVAPDSLAAAPSFGASHAGEHDIQETDLAKARPEPHDIPEQSSEPVTIVATCRKSPKNVQCQGSASLESWASLAEAQGTGGVYQTVEHVGQAHDANTEACLEAGLARSLPEGQVVSQNTSERLSQAVTVLQERVLHVEQHLEAATKPKYFLRTLGWLIWLIAQMYIYLRVVAGTPWSWIAAPIMSYLEVPMTSYVILDKWSDDFKAFPLRRRRALLILMASPSIVNAVGLFSLISRLAQYRSALPGIGFLAAHMMSTLCFDLALDSSGTPEQAEKAVARWFKPFRKEATIMKLGVGGGNASTLIALLSICPAIVAAFFVYYFGRGKYTVELACPADCFEKSCCAISTSSYSRFTRFVTFLAGNVVTCWAIVKFAAEAYFAHLLGNAELEGECGTAYKRKTTTEIAEQSRSPTGSTNSGETESQNATPTQAKQEAA